MQAIKQETKSVFEAFVLEMPGSHIQTQLLEEKGRQKKTSMFGGHASLSIFSQSAMQEAWREDNRQLPART